MKRILALLLALCLVLCLVACGNEDTSSGTTSDVSQTQSTTDTSSENESATNSTESGTENTTSTPTNSETPSITSKPTTSTTTKPTESSKPTDTSRPTETSKPTTSTPEPTYLKGSYYILIKSNNNFSDYIRYDLNFKNDGTANFVVSYYKAFTKNGLTENEKNTINDSIKNSANYYSNGVEAMVFGWESVDINSSMTIDNIFDTSTNFYYHYGHNDKIYLLTDIFGTVNSSCQRFNYTYDVATGKVNINGNTPFTSLSVKGNPDGATVVVNGITTTSISYPVFKTFLQ